MTKTDEKQETKNAVVTHEKQSIQINSDVIASLVLNGDLKAMTKEQKVLYYNQLCQSLGLNPATRPFQIIVLSGKETMYATKDCTEQLRKKYGISVYEMKKELLAEVGIYSVTSYVQDAQGRKDVATGAVNVSGMRGDNLANAMMKAETKSKRRATLSISGLGMLDESEIETIPNAVISNEPLLIPEEKKEDTEKKDVKEKAKKEAVAKLDKLPDNVKKGFELLGYTQAAQFAFCQKFKFDAGIILREINGIVDMNAKTKGAK